MIDRRKMCCLMGAVAVPRSRAAAAWKLATGYRAESFQGENLTQMAREVAAAGGPAIELHANSSLAKLAEIPKAVRDGRAEMGEVIMSGLATEFALAAADSLPFMTRTYSDARRLWKHQRPLLDKPLESSGLHILLAVPWPPQGLYSKKPVERLSDLAGLRMRTYNRTTERIAQLVSATPVDVPMVQVGEAFAQGRIDCMITSAVTGVENEAWRFTRHYYEINAWFPKNITFVGTKALAALAVPAHKALLDAAASAETRGWLKSEQVADAATQELRQRGIKVDAAPATLLPDLKRLGERFSVEWVRRIGTPANQLLIPYYAQQ
jgi:TRAP-type transport system periplasmic protein